MFKNETKEEYVVRILKTYKKNKSRLKMLKLGLVTDDDNLLGAVNYDSVRVQTSNLGSLDNNIIVREKEKAKLNKYITTVDVILESLNSKDRAIIENIYFENIKYIDIAYKNNWNDKKTVWDNKERIIRELAKII